MLPFLVPLITSLAPVLAETAAKKLLGDDNPMAGVAQRAILDVTETVIGDRISDKTAAEEAAVQIGSDPALKAEFQRLLNERLAIETAAELDTMRALLADTQSARVRELELAKLGKHDWRADALVATAIVAVIACVYSLTLDAVQSARDFVIAVGTMFATKIGTAFDYHYGSSAGSKAKDEALRLK